MYQNIFKIRDLDLDLQGQIGLQTSQIFFYLLKLTISSFTFDLNCPLILKMSQMGMKIGDADLDLPGQIRKFSAIPFQGYNF